MENRAKKAGFLIAMLAIILGLTLISIVFWDKVTLWVIDAAFPAISAILVDYSAIIHFVCGICTVLTILSLDKSIHKLTAEVIAYILDNPEDFES